MGRGMIQQTIQTQSRYHVHTQPSQLPTNNTELYLPTSIRNKTPDSQRCRRKVAITRIWGVKAKTIPVIVGALGAMPHSMKGNLKKILKNLKEETIQEIALCGTAHIFRKILYK